MDNFDKAFEIVIGLEGGLTNDPNDTGGVTKYGISQRAHMSVDVASLTLDEAKSIYKREYWDAFSCGDFRYPLDIYMFDTSVNHTHSFARRMFSGLSEITDLCEQRLYLIVNRMKEYNRIAQNNVSQRKFHRGWINRLERLIDSV